MELDPLLIHAMNRLDSANVKLILQESSVTVVKMDISIIQLVLVSIFFYFLKF